jgi:hypothetical protein
MISDSSFLRWRPSSTFKFVSSFANHWLHLRSL